METTSREALGPEEGSERGGKDALGGPREPRGARDVRSRAYEPDRAGPTHGIGTRGDVLFCIAVALAFATLQFVLQARVGLAPQEEGFLWYGVDAIGRGELPLRDFRSYDPGRYLWCAAWAKLFGGGILGLRAACCAFQALGLAAAACIALRIVPKTKSDPSRPSRSWILPIVATTALWMFPPWRPFESGLSLMAMLVGVRLLEHPGARRSFECGVFVGTAAFFGRNHALYAAVAFTLMHVFAFWRGARPGIATRIAALVSGTLVGLVPLGVMLLFVPGYAAAFLDSILFFIGRDHLNVPYPAAWPWTIDVATTHGIELAAAVALSAFFVLYAVGYALFGLVALRGKLGTVRVSAVLVAALCVGLPYVHHVSERSDVHHVAESIHPLLLGTFAFAFAPGRRRPRLTGAVAIAVLFGASLLAIGTEQPLGRRLVARGTPREFVELDVTGTRLSVDGVVARRLAAVRAHIESTVPRDAPLFLSTKLLVLYPMLGRRSPAWDIYPSWKADPDHEQRMLNEMSDVDWAFLQDVAVGGFEEKRLSNTYPMVWRHLQQDFQRIPTPDLADEFVFLHRR